MDAPANERGGPQATGPRRLSTPGLEAHLNQLSEHGRPGDQAPPVEQKTESKPRRIREMFGAIVPRYDLINRLMTLGLDRRWRRRTVALSEPHDALILDIATGTGDLACEAARQGARRTIGADFCPPMVAAARVKVFRFARLQSHFVPGKVYLSSPATGPEFARSRAPTPCSPRQAGGGRRRPAGFDGRRATARAAPMRETHADSLCRW